MSQPVPLTVDEYMAAFPEDTYKKMQQVRKAIQESAPDAVEKISYGIPTYDLHGNLVHFAAYKNHIGFYPAPSAIAAFKRELSFYEGAKGSVQFPLSHPMPLTLIKKIVEFRVKENLLKAKRKK